MRMWSAAFSQAHFLCEPDAKKERVCLTSLIFIRGYRQQRLTCATGAAAGGCWRVLLGVCDRGYCSHVQQGLLQGAACMCDRERVE